MEATFKSTHSRLSTTLDKMPAAAAVPTQTTVTMHHNLMRVPAAAVVEDADAEVVLVVEDAEVEVEDAVEWAVQHARVRFISTTGSSHMAWTARGTTRH